MDNAIIQQEKPASEHVWLNMSEASKRVGVSPELLRKAIAAGELKAYRKPITRELKGSKRHIFMRIHMNDIDDWVRSWEPVKFGGFMQ